MEGYYYLHENGDLIYKRFRPEQEPGGFVRHVWSIDTDNRADGWRIILEGLALKANRDRVLELKKKWHCDIEDVVNLLIHNSNPSLLEKEGLAIYLREIYDVEPDAWYDWLAATPKGQKPDFSTMPTSKK